MHSATSAWHIIDIWPAYPLMPCISRNRDAVLLWSETLQLLVQKQEFLCRLSSMNQASQGGKKNLTFQHRATRCLSTAEICMTKKNKQLLQLAKFTTYDDWIPILHSFASDSTCPCSRPSTAQNGPFQRATPQPRHWDAHLPPTAASTEPSSRPSASTPETRNLEVAVMVIEQWSTAVLHDHG